MEYPSVAAMTEAKVEAYRRKREITVEGCDMPKPVREFHDVSKPVREFRDVPKPIIMLLHLPPHCLRQGKGGREREREKKKKKKRGRGPPKALPSHRSQTGSHILVQARRRARWLAVPEPQAPAPMALGRHPVGSGQPPTGRPCHCHKKVAGGRRYRGRRRKEKKEGRRNEEKKKERKGRWPSSRPVLGRSPTVRQAPGGANGGPRPSSTSLSLDSSELGETERERRRGGEGHRRPSPHTGAKPAPVYWFGPGGMSAGSQCRSPGHQPDPMLGRHPVGSGRPPTSRPCHCHKEVAGGRRNRGRRRKEKKEERKKRKRKEKEGDHRRRPALGWSPVARQTLGGASGGPRPPSTSLSPGSGEPGVIEREREGGDGPGFGPAQYALWADFLGPKLGLKNKKDMGLGSV